MPGQQSESVIEVLNRFLKVTSDLIKQHRTVTTRLRHVIDQKSAENRILHDEREAHFRHQPCRKRKLGDGETCSQDNGSSVRLQNFFGEQPELSTYIRLPEKGQSKEPVIAVNLRTYCISDQYGRVVYDSGCDVNVENTLHRFVQPKLYPLDLTELKADCRHHYTVFTCAGPVRVTGYGLAEATVPYPDNRWGRVCYWAYYAPEAPASYRTRYGVLGSTIRNIRSDGRPLQQATGSAVSGPA